MCAESENTVDVILVNLKGATVDRELEVAISTFARLMKRDPTPEEIADMRTELAKA